MNQRSIWYLAIAETLVWAGMFYSFPALILQWENDLGWSKTEISATFTTALIVSALTAPLAGRLIDLGYGRTLLTGVGFFRRIGRRFFELGRILLDLFWTLAGNRVHDGRMPL